MGEGACPSLSNRLEWSCPLFLLLSRTVHLLAAPVTPNPGWALRDFLEWEILTVLPVVCLLPWLV